MIAGSIQTRAELDFRCDPERGRTFLYRRRAGGLCHVGKPYWDGTTLTLQLVNPTAGLFAGDEFELAVWVGEGARVAIECPSASRFHTMGSGESAYLEQSIAVAAGGTLDVRPEWTIPQADSDVSQKTRIDLAPNARLAYLELIAPGRVAHGECHRYRRFESQLSLRVAGRLVARERLVLDPEDSGWPLAVPGWEEAFLGNLWVVDPGIDPDLITRILEDLEASLGTDTFRLGGSRIEEGVYVFRLLSARALLLKRGLKELGLALASAAPFLARTSRRL